MYGSKALKHTTWTKVVSLALSNFNVRLDQFPFLSLYFYVFMVAIQMLIGSLSKLGRQRQRREAAKIFLSNPCVLVSIRILSLYYLLLVRRTSEPSNVSFENRIQTMIPSW